MAVSRRAQTVVGCKLSATQTRSQCLKAQALAGGGRGGGGSP